MYLFSLNISVFLNLIFMKATSITMYDVAIGLFLTMGTTFLTCIFTAKFLCLAIFENNSYTF